MEFGAANAGAQGKWPKQKPKGHILKTVISRKTCLVQRTLTLQNSNTNKNIFFYN